MQVLVALLPIQLLANVSGKAAADGLCTPMSLWKSRLQLAPFLAIASEGVNKQIDDFYFFQLSFINK